MALPLSSRTYLLLLRSTSTAPSSRLFYARPQSTLPSPPNHADLADDHSTDPLLRKLEDAIHRIIVRRAAPDWLPFIPGSSYWVPPHRSTAGIASLVEKLANPLTDEQSLSTTTVRGWPSSDFFIEGAHTIEVITPSRKSEVESSSNKEKLETIFSINVSKSEDEEG